MRRSPLRSPPRMRGKVSTTLQGDIIEGITPAYAGKRSQDVAELQSGWDHPRVCGEKMCCTAIAFRSSGLPPRMRGKAFHRFWHHRGQGITPAYAGKRPTQRHGRRYSRDHPRVCGEKNGICRAKVPHLGSPPRMRGKALCGLDVHIHAGITPAYAGKRAGRCPDGCTPWDYPRVCGEKCL